MSLKTTSSFAVLVTFLAFTAGFLFFAQPAFAKIMSGEQSVTIAPDEVVDEDLLVGSSVVTIEGTINGNLFVAGGQVTLEGTVKGSVFAAGGSVEINNAAIQGNLVVGAGNINISATEVGQGIIAGTGNLNIDDESRVNGGLVVGAGNLSLNAPVGKGILAGAGSATLNSEIQKDVQISVDQLTLGQGANLKGGLTYTSGQEAAIHTDAQIAGKVTKKAPGAQKEVELPSGLTGLFRQISLGFKFFSYLSSLLVGLIILYLFPKDSQKVAQTLLEKPWHSLGFGFLVLILTLPVAFLLAISVMGIPLAVLTILIWGVLIYLTKIFVGFLFGRSLLEALGRSSTSLYLSLVVGLAVYQILTLVPFLGWFVSLATITFGLGALFLCGRDYIFQNRKPTLPL